MPRVNRPLESTAVVFEFKTNTTTDDRSTEVHGSPADKLSNHVAEPFVHRGSRTGYMSRKVGTLYAHELLTTYLSSPRMMMSFALVIKAAISVATAST